MNIPMRNQRAAQLRDGSITEMTLWEKSNQRKKNDIKKLER
jgi:hypothetical protein